jgi:energy-coupling factor transporter ATP-binding protein EcfA2
MMQLDSLALYNADGEVRPIHFMPGRLNIITGESGTGKTSLIGILRFLLGSDSPHVPLGPIQDTVRWYGLLAHVDETHFFVARPAPAHGATTSQVVLAIGERNLPPMDALVVNANTDDLIAYVGGLIGIEDNLFVPPEGQTRRALVANLRHSLYYCFQGQGEIANPDILFHRQNRDFQKQAIRDTLPYFLGAQGMDALRKREELAALRRTIREKSGQLQRAQEQRDQGLGRASGLLAEVRSSGLLDSQVVVTSADEATVLLTNLLQEERPVIVLDDSDDRAEAERLIQRRVDLRQTLRDIGENLRGLDDFVNVSNDYGQELNEHRVRLASIGLVPDEEAEDASCPLCSTPLATVGTHAAIEQRLERVTRRLDLAQRDRPQIEATRGQLVQQRQAARTELVDIDAALDSLAQSDDTRATDRGLVAQQNFVRGRIAQYLETLPADTSGGVDALERELADLNERAEALSDELDPETLRSAVESQLAIASRKMTELARALPLEHSEHGVRIDPHRLTVVADTLQGPAYMDAGAIGSGMSWVGYHLTAYLALQDFFITARRPVPSFLMLDQPSQAFFPRDRQEGGDLSELSDTDRDNTRKLYKMLYDVTQALGGKLQVIVFDHADFTGDEWFQDSIIETWRDGQALIPQIWIEVTKA